LNRTILLFGMISSFLPGHWKYFITRPAGKYAPSVVLSVFPVRKTEQAFIWKIFCIKRWLLYDQSLRISGSAETGLSCFLNE
jgi:hypothetical protein